MRRLLSNQRLSQARQLLASRTRSLELRAINIARQYGGALLYAKSTLSNLYQNSNGTGAVTANGDPIGLWLDQSFNGELGANLVTNGDFSNGTTGWTLTGGNGLATVTSGVLRLTATPSTPAYLVQAFSSVVGRSYQVTGTVVSKGGVFSAIRKSDNNTASANVENLASDLGTATTIFTATSSTTFIVIQQNGIGSFSEFANISVREVLGYQATQATGANKPVTTRLSPNLLSWTESFDNAYWTKADLSATANKLTENNLNSPHRLFNFTSVILNAGLNYTASVYVKAAERSRLGLYAFGGSVWGSNKGLIFDCNTATIIHQSNILSSSVSDEGDGWFRISFTAVTSGTTGTAGIGLYTVGSTYTFDGFGQPTYQGDGVSGILVRGANLTQSSSVLPYEPADAFPRVGNFAISTNGTNQFMTITPPAITNACTIVWAGRVNALGASWGGIIDQAGGVTGLAISIRTDGGIAVQRRAPDASIASTVGGLVLVGVPVVISVILTATTARIRINGITVLNATHAVTFATTQSTLFSRNGNQDLLNAITAEYFIDNQAVPDADLLNIERYGAQQLRMLFP